MDTALIVRFAALSAPAVLTLALAQFRAVLERSRLPAGMPPAQAGGPASPTC